MHRENTTPYGEAWLLSYGVSCNFTLSVRRTLPEVGAFRRCGGNVPENERAVRSPDRGEKLWWSRGDQEPRFCAAFLLFQVPARKTLAFLRNAGF